MVYTAVSVVWVALPLVYALVMIRSAASEGNVGSDRCARLRARVILREEVIHVMTVRAVWNGAVLAESDDTVVVEGNHYFPPESLIWEYFASSRSRSLCPWKGIASYYTITVDGQANPDAAWRYPRPTPLARKIKNRVAFWNGIEIVDDTSRRAR